MIHRRLCTVRRKICLEVDASEKMLLDRYIARHGGTMKSLLQRLVEPVLEQCRREERNLAGRAPVVTSQG